MWACWALCRRRRFQPTVSTTQEVLCLAHSKPLSQTMFFEDKSSIPVELCCGLCAQPWSPETAVACPKCEEIFCRACIEDHLAKSTTCPKCNQNVDPKDMRPRTASSSPWRRAPPCSAPTAPAAAGKDLGASWRRTSAPARTTPPRSSSWTRHTRTCSARYASTRSARPSVPPLPAALLRRVPAPEPAARVQVPALPR
jgi:hypothetical protein